MPPILTERLALVSLSAGALQDLLAGRAAAAERRSRVRLPESFARRAQRLLEVRLADVQRDPGARAWLLRLVALRDEHPRTVVGLIGFHGRPDASGRVEIGYEIFTPFRRHGYATEAVRGLLAWASRRHRVRTFVAAIGPENEASMRLARRMGFRQVGVQVDESDGLELAYELEWPRRRRSGDGSNAPAALMTPRGSCRMSRALRQPDSARSALGPERRRI